MQVKFDPVEDRMRVGLHAADGTECAYWATRRQWLGLLERLLALDDMSQDTQSTDAGHKQIVASIATTSLRQQGPVSSQMLPCSLRSVRVSRLNDVIRIAFVPAKKSDADLLAVPEGYVRSSVLTIPQVRVAQFVEILKTKGEMAGWDVEAGLKRLQTSRLASAILLKAKSGVRGSN